ncbi:MAG: hypothetical protein J6P98_08645 [Clostridia bacterium]|nr:hypothetical protein [Clostridia bacterium]
MCEDITRKLDRILREARPADAGRILCEHAADFAKPEEGFSSYMRSKLREKGLRQQEVFLKADISEGYGYKLISGEKRTRRRDTLLRLFFAAGFTTEEASRALRLGEMPTLYPRFPRDAVLIIAFNSGLRDPAAVDELLIKHGLEPLCPSR